MKKSKAPVKKFTAPLGMIKGIKTFREFNDRTPKAFEKNPEFVRVQSQQHGHRKSYTKLNEAGKNNFNLLGTGFKINILEEDASEGSHDSQNAITLKQTKSPYDWMNKRFGGSSTKLKVKRRSQPMIETQKIETSKKFLVAK